MQQTTMIPPPQAQLNLLTLPAAQRQVLLYLIREGPTAEAVLAQRLQRTPNEMAEILAALKAFDAITVDADGCLAAVMGQRRSRTLPARLWPALQTTARLYSAQEIVTLRTVLPILQFARARLGQFTDHGPGHVLRVKVFATQLGYVAGLTARERHYMRAAALLHDVGNVVDRDTHHIVSQETVEKLTSSGQLPFSSREAMVVGLLCRWHRREYDPSRTDQVAGESIRTGLIASILRVADALDSDYRRVDYDEKFQRVLALFYPEEMPFLTDLDTILGIRICCAPDLRLQIFVQHGVQVDESYHIRALHKDVAETPLACMIQVIACSPRPLDFNPVPDGASIITKPRAIIASPFDPHSLIMAALSRKHLLAEGHAVDLLIYPDTSEAPRWLWRVGLAEREPSGYAQLILIGDRPDATTTPALLAQLQRWQANDVQVAVLNRHEANWERLPTLLQPRSCGDLNIVLGGDWAYFWGNRIDEADLFWGRIAALCTRDPIQSTVGLTADEQVITQGLLQTVFAGIASLGEITTESARWVTSAFPILDRIAADDRDWFAEQAAAFVEHYTAWPALGDVEGKVVRFDLTRPPAPYALYWGLEAAIEAQGRAPVRGFCFTTPYAIAVWSDRSTGDEGDTDMVELLAISHWREEEATPIRLLYPSDLAPAPEGNESTIRVRLPAMLARRVMQALIAACNES